MDECIRTGVSTTEGTLPGRLGLRRRAPMLYRRLMRGCVLIDESTALDCHRPDAYIVDFILA